MAKPSQPQQPGVKRAPRDTPGKAKQPSDPGGIAALRLWRRMPSLSCRGCDPLGIVRRGLETGGVARCALTPGCCGCDGFAILAAVAQRGFVPNNCAKWSQIDAVA